MPLTAADLLVEEYPKVDFKDTASALLAVMADCSQHFALVFDGKSYVGLASKKWLLTSRIDADAMKVSNLFNKRSKAKSPVFVPLLEPLTALKEVCRLLAASDSCALPVVARKPSADGIKGVVIAKEVVLVLKDAYKGVPAMDLASSPVITFDEDQPLGHVINILSRKGISRAPVVGSDGRLSGVLSLTDVLEKYQVWMRHSAQKVPGAAAKHGSRKLTGFGTGEKHDPLKLPAKDFMHAPPEGVLEATAKLSQVIEVMAAKDIGSVILVRDGKPMGIVTAKDILEDYSEIRPSRKIKEL